MSTSARPVGRFVVVVFAVLGVGAPGAMANHQAPFEGTLHDYGDMVEYDLEFPVRGRATFTDTFYAARSGGQHHAQDLMSQKMTPVVAAASATIRYVNYSRNPDDLRPARCCTLVLDHDDGWSTWYIHLNNDTPGTDDGIGWGIAPGILPGAHVAAGQLIGWVGDSGNAESTSPHLHFELFDAEGVLVNPYEALKTAQAEWDGSVPGLLPASLGLVDPSTSRWYLGTEDGNVVSFYFGNPGDFPLMGDWDCDGDDTPGMYRQSDGFAYLRESNSQGVAEIRFFFGDPGDIPIAGDFDGDGCDTVSIYRPSEGRVFIINELGGDGGSLGAAEFAYYFGNPGDKPFVGDFDGDGIETIGLHRESTGFVYFRDTHSSGVADGQFFFGIPADRLVAGDWDLDGIDSPAVYRPSTTTFYLRHTNTQGYADQLFTFGNRTWLPVAGVFW
jgi:hypothetical protein